MPVLFLLNDTSEVPNWGAQATMRALRKMLYDRIPELELMTLTQGALLRTYAAYGVAFGRRVYLDPQSRLLDRSPMLRGVMENRAKAQGERLFPASANGLELTARHWERTKGNPYVRGFLEKAARSDCVVHNGELLNYSLTEVSSRGVFLTWLAKCRLEKPAAVVNQTTPSQGQDPVMSGLLQATCEKIDVVTVREPYSLRALQDLGVRARLIPDPTFWLEEDDFDEAEALAWQARVGLEKPYACLSLSSGLPIRGSAPALLPLLKQLQELAPSIVLLAYGGGNRLLQSVASSATNCFVYSGSYRGVAPLLRGAEFLVTGHYHNIILGSMVGCPFVPLRALSHKIEGLLELLEWPHPQVHNLAALQHATPGILASAERVAEDRASLSRRLLLQASVLRERSVETAETLCELMNRS